jgi:hypothetical protein
LKTTLRLLSAVAWLLRIAGLAVRTALLGLIGAVALRLGGLVAPHELPAFWLMLATALLLVAAPAWAAGEDSARRTVRDRAIERAIKEYEQG